MCSVNLLHWRYVVDNKGLTVGDFVLFATYIMQLYVPLNWLGRITGKNFFSKTEWNSYHTDSVKFTQK